MTSKNLLSQIHKDILSNELKLPTLPEISLRIKRAVNAPDVTLRHLAQVASLDPAFCGYVIQVANSPLFRGNVEVQKVDRAIERLGLNNTRRIAMTYAVRAIFSFNNPKIATWLKRVWHNSTHTAAVAGVIAEYLDADLDRDQVVLAGLFQDIGCLPLLDKAAMHPSLISDDVAMFNLFARYAANVGCAIMRHWGLEDELVEVTKNRDNWHYQALGDIGLTDVVLVAKLHTYLGQSQPTPMPRLIQLPSFIKLQLQGELSPEQSLRFIHDARQQISAMQRALGG